jgi:hypothetical protein
MRFTGSSIKRSFRWSVNGGKRIQSVEHSSHIRVLYVRETLPDFNGCTRMSFAIGIGFIPLSGPHCVKNSSLPGYEPAYRDGSTTALVCTCSQGNAAMISRAGSRMKPPTTSNAVQSGWAFTQAAASARSAPSSGL